jgi:UrcA family protein
MIRPLYLAVVAAMVTASATAAESARDVVVHHVNVAYGDLNLSSAAGRSALQARIDAAAAQACGGNPAFASSYRDAPLFYHKEFERCRTEARHEAVTILERHGVRVATR